MVRWCSAKNHKVVTLTELLKTSKQAKHMPPILYVSDVGDGLCIAIPHKKGNPVHIDCGSKSKNGSNKAIAGWHNIYGKKNSPDVFILSHFHNDHYNGIIEACNNRSISLNINTLYFPIIPIFQRRNEFLTAIFAINMLILGDLSGSMEYDLIESIKSVNTIPFHSIPCSKGQTLNINGSSYEILWPPKILTGQVPKIVDTALNIFKEAKKEDPILKILHDKIKNNIINNYTKEVIHNIRNKSDNLNLKEIKIKKIPRKLIPIVEKANKYLRKAANRFSIAMLSNNNLLFMGDLEAREIRKVTNDLIKAKRTIFYIIINPHHGTHWSSKLSNICSIFSISSHGKKLSSHFRKEYLNISKIHLSTWTNGNIRI